MGDPGVPGSVTSGVACSGRSGLTWGWLGVAEVDREAGLDGEPDVLGQFDAAVMRSLAFNAASVASVS